MEEADVKRAGEFEKHTKGIGMKLFGKMGYKGGGLGINEQGIAAPIEVKLRPGKKGIGYDDSEEAARPVLQELDEKSVPSPSQSLVGRTRENLGTKRASKKKAYITAEEVLARKQEMGVETVNKVIDMRGPQVENLSAEDIARENDVQMPELQHKIKLLVDIAEYNILKLSSNQRNEMDIVVALLKEKEKLQKVACDQKQQLGNTEEIISVLDQIGEKNSSGLLTLESLAKSFIDLQTRFPDEYTSCNLSWIAFSYALPLFVRLFQGWDPLQNPTHGTEVVSSWKKLLQGKDSSDISSTTSPYMQLVMKAVLPAMRTSGTNSWQVREPEQMLSLLNSWEELLPPPLLQSILDTVVMPKISASVDSWDPRREPIPIHSWIHPWLPLLHHKLGNCYHTIRYGLASVLHAWHPSDMSAYDVVSPWKTVFDPVNWEQLMIRYIVPKLLTVMHELQINPASQNLDHFYWVRTWMTAIPTHHMLQLMDVFFDKWQEVLYHLLCSKQNFEEVTKWYLGWKELLPPELQANEHVRFRLSLGLEMMNRAVEGMIMEPPSLKDRYLRVHEQRQFETRRKAASLAQHRPMPSLDDEISAEGGDEMSLEEVIEIHAQQNGLLFKPKPGRMQDGYQIYGFGSISITIDSLNRKVFAQTEGRWSLVSLEHLLEVQNRSKM